MWKQLLGDPAKQQLRRYKPLIAEINRLEPKLQGFSDDDLRQLTGEFREQLSKVATSNLREKQLLDELLPQVYALVREGSRRVLGLRHHDVQLLGRCILHHGGIAEMQTGEGKTLVSTLPAFLNALPGKGVHAVTVNDYLARRDAELMGQVERFFLLQQIDLLWREHLQAMNGLKESVNLRSYAQKDPLIEYKNEGYDLFLEMMERLRANVLRLMFTFQPTPQPAPQPAAAAVAAPAEQQESAGTALPRFTF